MIDRIRDVWDVFWYHVRRNDWLWYPRRFFDDYDHTDIDRPIFLVGNQGAGLTLVSRMLRRHPDVVSITGDHTYWSGAGEMQRVMVTRLPPELRLAGKLVGTDPEHPKYSPPRSWSYGCDELVDCYHLTEADLNQEAAQKFRFLIREALHRYGSLGRENRFIDKSQVFTLKIRYIEKALSDTIGRVLADSRHVDRFTTFRFEDILREPEHCIRRLCDFVGLDYRESLLPAADDGLPLGSRFRGRWYPLRTDVNDKYLDNIPSRFVNVIDERCGAIAGELGYEKPEGASAGAA